MQIEQRRWTAAAGWTPDISTSNMDCAQLVFAFGAACVTRERHLLNAIRTLYPVAWALGCSTAGEICGAEVFDEALVVTAIHFEHTQVRAVEVCLDANASSQAAGEYLARTLPHSVPRGAGGENDPLIHVLVISDGLVVNGSDLVRGLMNELPSTVTITGGLAADGARFRETTVLTSTGFARNTICCVGLYGDRLDVGIGSLGGWDPFGPERVVTRAIGNELFELDGRPALALYKQYLGEHADGLPATGLLFPLSVRPARGPASLMRTILSVNEGQQSLTFAGDVPEGSYARLTKSNVNRLVEGAIGAARASLLGEGDVPKVAILISCVGRKLVLKQRIEEEVEAVHDTLGEQTVLSGFYSYGEIAPFSKGGRSELHNQTMTITTLSEH